MALLVFWTAAFLAVTLGTVLGEVPGPYPSSAVPSNSVTSSSVGQYVQRYAAPYRESPSYGVQTGYEGYLIPAPPPDTDSDEEGGLLNFLTDLGEHLGGLGGKKEDDLDGSEDNEGNSLFSARPLLLLPLLHKLALPLKLLAKLGLWLLAPLSLVLLGGALTVGVCVFTPICTLKLVGFGFTRDSVRTFIDRDRLASLSTFVTDAINKYQQLQKTSNMKEIRRFSAKDNTNSTLEQKTPKVQVLAETKTRKK